MSEPLYTHLHPWEQPRAGGPPLVPASPTLVSSPTETLELFAAPNFAGVVSWFCWWARISCNAGPSTGGRRGLQPLSPASQPDQRPQRAGLLTPPVKIILAAALVFSPGRAAVTEVTHNHSAFSGISLER